MTNAAYYARMYELHRKESRKPETAPWWVDYLIAGSIAVMAWLLFVGC